MQTCETQSHVPAALDGPPGWRTCEALGTQGQQEVPQVGVWVLVQLCFFPTMGSFLLFLNFQQ